MLAPLIKEKKVLQPRLFQRSAIDSVYRYFECRSGNPLIVIPTGGGKSLIMAILMQEVMERWAGQKILLLAHRKELLEQNRDELLSLWPDAPIGMYSASLKKKQLGKDITIAGIQSIAKNAQHLGHISLIIVDEAHLIPAKKMGQYRKLISKLQEINPHVKVIGLTATPYRLDHGLLIEGKDKIFDDIIYEIGIAELIKQGWLCPLTSKVSEYQPDLSKVHIKKREFVAKELEEAMTKDELIKNTVEQIIHYGQDRDSWLLFCAGKLHAKIVCDALVEQGISAVTITSDTPQEERSKNLAMFKDKKIRAITNCDVLTTGFNAPNIDLLAMLRPTKSTCLYVQMIGRGSRLFPEKKDCLVLDFAGNIMEHGPVTDIKIKNKKEKDGTTKKSLQLNTSIKVCEKCRQPCHVLTRECPTCGYMFPDRINHSDKASNLDIMGNEETSIWVEVDSVDYGRHQKPGAPDSMVVTYNSGLNFYREWVCLNHIGYPREKALQWVCRRAKVDDIQQVTLDNVLKFSTYLLAPKKIRINKAGKYFEVKGYEF